MKYRVVINSEFVDKDGKTVRTLKAGSTVEDLTPAQVKGLLANSAIEPAKRGK
jgi:hypothetical protein